MKVLHKVVRTLIALSFVILAILLYYSASQAAQEGIVDVHAYPMPSAGLVAKTKLSSAFYITAVFLSAWGGFCSYLLITAQGETKFHALVLAREVVVGTLVGVIGVLLTIHFSFSSALVLATGAVCGMFNHSFVSLTEKFIPKIFDALGVRFNSSSK